jgi:hypothetical protein
MTAYITWIVLRSLIQIPTDGIVCIQCRWGGLQWVLQHSMYLFINRLCDNGSVHQKEVYYRSQCVPSVQISALDCIRIVACVEWGIEDSAWRAGILTDWVLPIDIITVIEDLTVTGISHISTPGADSTCWSRSNGSSCCCLYRLCCLWWGCCNVNDTSL